LDSLLNSQPALAGVLGELRECHSKRHWHQLTELLLGAVFDGGALAGVDLQAFYHGFVKHWEAKMRPTALVRFVAEAANRSVCGGADRPTAAQVEASHALLDALVDSDSKKKHMGEGACAYLAHERLSLAVRSGNGLAQDLPRQSSLREQISAAEANVKMLPSSELVDSVVSASFYRVASEFYQAVGPAEKFYKHALMYLAYTPLATMSASDQIEWAKRVSVAALVGQGVYNFGEVLAHDCLAALRGSDSAWMLSMLEAFNRGDIASFNTILSDNEAAVLATPALASAAAREAVKKKITLLAVVELVFQRPAHERTISFVDIGSAIAMSVDEVEWVLMRAMSVGLIKGVIDQVSQQLCATWVQPRILDKSQVGSIVERLQAWGSNVDKVVGEVGESAIFVR
jgi:26S proteasome regulatory subunit N9